MRAEDFTKIPIAEATMHPDHSCFVELKVDKWWAVTEDDCILVYKGHSVQCNDNRAITERVVEIPGHPGVKVVQLPVVYMKHNCHDYVM